MPNLRNIVFLFLIYLRLSQCRRQFSKEHILELREEVREMFQFAYQGYLDHAKDYDELRPITCDGVDTWGSYSLTLIDALDTLAVMGNFTEFRRVVSVLEKKINFDKDINVSVFETNIRIVGGLLSAHLMSRRAGVELEPGWPCNGPLLRLAEDVAKRILPAFDTKTGMPYGTVNLKYGVPNGETPITCTAGVGTFIVEFGALSRLTGDPIYEETALNALYSLWEHQSPIGLFGNHIDVQTGRWTAQDAGIGSAVDSYYEYLVKGSIMLNRPDLLEMFTEGRKAIDKYVKRDDWYVWVSMNRGQVTIPVFQSLEAYWPGVLSLIGDIKNAMRSIHNYHTVWKQYGFLPEFYNIINAEAGNNRESYPLRPELVESAMLLYRATKDPFMLEIGEDMLKSIKHSAKTDCGYATIKNVRTHEKENRMESFFLAETTKYLYLLFDPDNFMHNNGREGVVIDTPNGQCVIETGGYIFNTEAHPIDPSALSCCYDIPPADIFANFNLDDYQGDLLAKKERKFDDLERFACDGESPPEMKDANFTIDLEVAAGNNNPSEVSQTIAENFEKIKKENTSPKKSDIDYNTEDIFLLFEDGRISRDKLKKFMNQHKVSKKVVNNTKGVFGVHMYTGETETLENAYIFHLKHKFFTSIKTALSLDEKDNNNSKVTIHQLKLFLEVLDHFKDNKSSAELPDELIGVYEIMLFYQNELEDAYDNTTKIFNFIFMFARDVRNNEYTLDFTNQLEEEEKPVQNTEIIVELFDGLRTVAILRKLLLESIENLNNLKETKQTENTEKDNSNDDLKTTEDPLNEENHLNDDIIIADSSESEVEREPIIEKPETLILAPNRPEGNRIEERQPRPEIPKPKNNDNNLLTSFVETIIKSTMPRKSQFDAQLFLQKIRSKGKYANVEHKYELLTCRAKPFAERYSYRTEIF